MEIKRTEKVRELEKRGYKDMIFRMYYSEEKSYTDIVREISRIEDERCVSEKRMGLKPEPKTYDTTVLARALYAWKMEELEDYPGLKEKILRLDEKNPHNYADISAWLEEKGIRVDSRNSRKYGERLKNIIDEWKVDDIEIFENKILELYVRDKNLAGIEDWFIKRDIYIDRHILEKAVDRWYPFRKPTRNKKRKEATEDLFPGAGVRKIKKNRNHGL